MYEGPNVFVNAVLVTVHPSNPKWGKHILDCKLFGVGDELEGVTVLWGAVGAAAPGPGLGRPGPRPGPWPFKAYVFACISSLRTDISYIYIIYIIYLEREREIESEM